MEHENQNNQPKQFLIYRDGELDKLHYCRTQAERVLRGVGHVAYKSLELAVNVVDEMVEAVN